jgi:hypothetical protein
MWAQQPRFGEAAAQIARICASDMAACLEHQQQAGGRLGEILCTRGILSQAELGQALASQARWLTRQIEWARRQSLFPYPGFLTLVLPALNEEDVIEDTVAAAVAILPELVERFEVIVIDDGSHDRTAALVAAYNRRDERVRLIRHPSNLGYGVAVRNGFRAARGDLLSFSDADGQFNFIDLALLLARLPGHDMVIGYRYRRADHWTRLLNAWGWNRLIRLFLGVRVRDLDCALKIFRRPVVEQLRLTATGSAINAEIMAQCVRGPWEICQTPVRHYARCSGQATGAALRIIARAFRELPSLRRYRFAPRQTVAPAATVTMARVAVAPPVTRRGTKVATAPAPVATTASR